MDEVSVAPLPPLRRLVLRGPDAAAGAVLAAFGVAPPERLLTATQAGARAALRLGPDEWLLLAEAGAGEPDAPGASLVDVSDGRAAFRVAGPGAADLLNEGCPLDLSDPVFPPGTCTRTLFGKAEIVLWRPGPEVAFHVEVARSFAAYVVGFLREATPT